jgi:hypothetical protein
MIIEWEDDNLKLGDHLYIKQRLSNLIIYFFVTIQRLNTNG